MAAHATKLLAIASRYDCRVMRARQPPARRALPRISPTAASFGLSQRHAWLGFTVRVNFRRSPPDTMRLAPSHLLAFELVALSLAGP